ncbi:leucine-rich repeat domain-containing protein [Treponema phagedenis]|uniref:Leucine-rich repeat domain-containing protein n=3 Tax=Treponema phagedenis TaxID=162 RepID=A0A0B7GU73_TREPH|nr:hypothetical protein HMPREF9554_01689 [Treponema phagedenis F0421]QEJ95715.1 leucine-rich repeat domain-containing protein [Treponema phagedenis]QEJ98815.1 leucine-rich repeat domain-containing protein [Treponema phagedenis]QEK00519.1 leucine-rich repeat domain-containing protein [Treponema phagedenis]QEK04320.1 leucine-rich repeat domain-containing protein [Treponema phagedenis]
MFTMTNNLKENSMHAEKTIRQISLVFVLLLFLSGCVHIEKNNVQASSNAVQQKIEKEEIYDYLIFTDSETEDSGFIVKANPQKIQRISKLFIPKTYRTKPITAIAGNGFMNCTSLTEISIPDSIREIPDSAFKNCSMVRKLTIAPTIAEIGVAAFMNCGNLQEIHITAGIQKIRNSAFANCVSLKEITFEKGEELTIYERAFTNCGFSKLIFPDRIVSIKNAAFYNCKELTQIALTSPVPPELGQQVFMDTSLESVLIPSNAYETAENWESYARLMQTP